MSDFSKLEYLSQCCGSGTSLVTLIARAGTKAADLSQLITKEIGAATNIKDRKNRNGVLDALRSIHQYTKSLSSLPETGVAIFAGCYI